MTLNASDRRHKIVLGVDDEAENLSLLKSLVEGAGFIFIGASSGEECVTLAMRAQPRLILLDIQMLPNIDGFETCRKLRLYPQLNAVPVVFLTARRSGEDVRKCLKAGGNDFIVKPFDPIKLIERVEYWVGRRITS
jgi:CheY-like chemotaxis protein